MGSSLMINGMLGSGGLRARPHPARLPRWKVELMWQGKLSTSQSFRKPKSWRPWWSSPSRQQNLAALVTRFWISGYRRRVVESYFVVERHGSQACVWQGSPYMEGRHCVKI